MKRYLLIALLGLLALPIYSQSVSPSTIQKRENRRGMVLEEWNKAVGSNMPFLDHKTTYDEYGRKIEEVEYASYGQKSRVVSEYPPDSDETAKVVREIEYNDRDRVVRIREFEYNDKGEKKRQLNYYPNGKLESVKVYKYVER